MEITAKLSSTSLKQAANQVREYESYLQTKVREVLERLVDKGISIAEQTIGGFGKYITFSKETDAVGVIMVAQEINVIRAEWLRYNKPVSAEVSPLLMAEFGAGPHAIIWEGTDGDTSRLPDGKTIGRGTFPNQTHAFENSWYYMDMSGNWQVASGIHPTRPLHNAVLEIINTVNSTVREVFGNGSN